MIPVTVSTMSRHDMTYSGIGVADYSTISFIQDRYDRMLKVCGDGARGFIEKAKSAFDRATDSFAATRYNLLNKLGKSVRDHDYIGATLSQADIEKAGYLMQRYLMANPNYRAMFIKQQVDGYAETYHDRFPGQVGEDHYDYRRVMDGLVTFAEHDENGNENWQCTQYGDDLLPGDADLTLLQQMDICQSWRLMDAIADSGRDPVSNKKL